MTTFLNRLYKDHKVKSDQVRVLKKKLVRSIPIGKLEEMFAFEKQYEVNPRDYMGWLEFDDKGYAEACARNEARIELLEELIYMKERD